MVNLKAIEIEGFGSIKHLDYKFDSPGLNSIIGRNGAGKTTILNALVWGLYKQTLKKNSTIEPWPELSEGYKGTKVVIKFGNCEIIRCKEYKGKILGKAGKNRLVILEKGQEVMTARNKGDGEEWIRKKIGYSFELFKNTVIFGQLVKRITQEDGPNKKRVFDEAFETHFINQAKELAAKKLDDLCGAKGEQESKVSIFRALVKQTREEYVRIKAIIANFQQDQAKQIGDRAQEILKLNIQLAKLGDVAQMNKELKSVRKGFDDGAVSAEFMADLKVNKAESELEKAEALLKKSKGELRRTPTKCEACGRSLNPARVREIKKGLKVKIGQVKREIKFAKQNLNKAKKAHNEVKERLENNKEVSSRIKELENKIRTAELESSGINAQIKEKQREIREIRERQSPITDLKDFKLRRFKNIKNLREAKTELKSINRKVRLHEWLIKEPLSNSGLKAFIFDNMLFKLNQQLKQYRSTIGWGIKVYVEMSSAHKNIEISVLRGKDEVPYEDLSGGQKQLVDFTLALALNDTVNLAKPINCLFMDEVFESLDKENVEVVTQLITDKAKTRCIHIVTHNSSFDPVGNKKTYVTQNKKGFTVLAK
jgi:exonuclease SbcC